jgi:hypothetical protein
MPPHGRQHTPGVAAGGSYHASAEVEAIRWSYGSPLTRAVPVSSEPQNRVDDIAPEPPASPARAPQAQRPRTQSGSAYYGVQRRVQCRDSPDKSDVDSVLAAFRHVCRSRAAALARALNRDVIWTWYVRNQTCPQRTPVSCLFKSKKAR